MCGAGGQGDIRTFPSFPVSLKLLKIKATGKKKNNSILPPPKQSTKMIFDGSGQRTLWPAIKRDMASH